MRISVIGSGYVGLITAAGFAENGHTVICVDVLQEKINAINKKKSPIYEKGLDEILKRVVGKNLTATTDLRKAVMGTDMTFLCVGTPSNGDGSVDLKYVKKASEDIGRVLKEKRGYHVVVVKSTVIPGTTEDVVIPVLERNSGRKVGRDFGVAMNPEFLREGVAIEDFMNPDRIVIGASDKKAGDFVESVYHGFSSPILRTDIKTAEMIKYASNAFLATKISFINEIGNICKKLGIDVYDVAKGIGLDHRISPHFLRAGIGFGGSCFPKDVKALVYKAREIKETPAILNSVLEVNKKQPLKILDIAKKKAGKLKGKRVAVLGLAFKAETDDMRESPAIAIVNELVRKGAKVAAYDPKATENAKAIFGDKIKYARSATEALRGSELALIVTDWIEFKNLNFKEMKKKVVIDGRKVINELPNDVEYEGVCW